MAYPNPYQMSYPGGASYPPYGAPQVEPEIQQWFDAVDQDKSGRINANELQSALVNGNGQNFNIAVCDLMIGMFDKEKSGTIDIIGFQQLYRYVNQWLDTFRQYDRNNSGQMEEAELMQAFQQMGYRFSQQFVNFLINKADQKQHRFITVDQFILYCIKIQRLTEAFRTRDTEMKGVITVGFEDFLTSVLNCI